ncbi:MAG: hypothetical protein Q4A44_04735 [Bacteroidales bacterium]|nr:hypothetical protein [Bacteroidales bacterium]
MLTSISNIKSLRINLASVLGNILLALLMLKIAITETALPQRIVAVGFIVALTYIWLREKVGVWGYGALVVIGLFVNPVSSLPYEQQSFWTNFVSMLILACNGALLLLLKANGRNLWQQIFENSHRQGVK